MSVARPGEVENGGPRDHFSVTAGDRSRGKKSRWGSRWPLVAMTLVIVFSMGRLAGALQKEQEILRAKAISAEKFEIRGADKKLRASLLKGPDGAALLSFFDEGGNPRLIMGLDAKGAPIVSFFGDKQAPSISIGFDSENGEPGIHLFDGQQEPALSLGITKGIGPDMTIGRKGQGQILMSAAGGFSSAIQISDSKNNPRLLLNVSDAEPAILLLGDNRAIRASWQVHADGSVSFSLRDTQSRQRLVIMTDKDGKPSIRFLDPDRKEAKAL